MRNHGVQERGQGGGCKLGRAYAMPMYTKGVGGEGQGTGAAQIGLRTTPWCTNVPGAIRGWGLRKAWHAKGRTNGEATNGRGGCKWGGVTLTRGTEIGGGIGSARGAPTEEKALRRGN